MKVKYSTDKVETTLTVFLPKNLNREKALEFLTDLTVYIDPKLNHSRAEDLLSFTTGNPKETKVTILQHKIPALKKWIKDYN